MGNELLVLGVLFVIAYVLGRVGKLIGLPAIPIYMLVGLIASPHVDWFPLDFKSEDVELIAVVGLIFLLFSLGLEFDQDEFFGNIRSLLLSGGTRIVINMGAGFLFGLWVGWGTREASFEGERAHNPLVFVPYLLGALMLTLSVMSNV